jgi:hypothetical protein
MRPDYDLHILIERDQKTQQPFHGALALARSL